MKPLSVSIDTGSPSGFHYWAEWHKCPMKRYLADIAKSAGQERKDESLALMAGSVFHAHMALFFEGKPRHDTQTLRFTQSRGRIWTPSERARSIGAGLFKSFRANYPADIFGRVTAVEQAFKVKKAEWLPAGMTLTGRTDLETRVTKKHATRLEKEFGIQVELGDWIVDHKSAAGLGHVRSYDFALQFVAYLAAAQQRKKNLRGLLANVAVKSNPVIHKVVPIALPTPNELTFLKAWFAEALALSKERPPRMRDACYDWAAGKPCLYSFTQQCPRK